MGLAHRMKLIVKRTFLECIVVDEVDKECSADGECTMSRALTDSVLRRAISSKSSNTNLEEPNLESAEQTPVCSSGGCGEAFATDAPALEREGTSEQAAVAIEGPVRALEAAVGMPMCFMPGATTFYVAVPVPVAPSNAARPYFQEHAQQWHQDQDQLQQQNQWQRQQHQQRRDCSIEKRTEGTETRTTVLLRNLPNNYTRAMLLQLLDEAGFRCRYNFLYLPIDFSTRAGLGYAFVNMLTAEDAARVHERLEGFKRWSIPSGKVCSVGWSDPHQGLEANIERYRGSRVMHASVPDDFKPAVFEHGARVAFPPAFRKLKPPRARAQH